MILLDTHVWVRWLAPAAHPLPATALAAIAAADSLAVSAISCWEVVRLHKRGRIELLMDADQWLGKALGACRAWGVDSEKRPQRGQFLPDLQAHSPAMGQKTGKKWTAEAASQPTIPKSDRLLEGSGVGCIAITREIAARAATLGDVHRDPADRIIMASAVVMGIPLLTLDEAIHQYPEMTGLFA